MIFVNFQRVLSCPSELLNNENTIKSREIKVDVKTKREKNEREEYKYEKMKKTNASVEEM